MSTRLPYKLAPDSAKTLGLIVLQSDETVEDELTRAMPLDTTLLVSRVPSGTEVTEGSLAGMAANLTQAAQLFPRGKRFDAVGYACTSGTSVIGSARVAELVRAGVQTAEVTNPVDALVAACRAQGLSRLAFLSPYIESVSDHLRHVLGKAGIETPVFGTFAEAAEARVARIDAASIRDGAAQLAAKGGVDGLFLSCTNLRTAALAQPLSAELGLPVWSSNLVLRWHLLHLAGAETPNLPRPMA
ncbi:maleate cis-trans isomerase family protein [Pseudaestuariivita sp.]|uniref:maleate cis-trans isomerase family protein n=1 Tax=Pseudaestuariivita sp. TaxID=2211669 RepID=UPI0040599396